MKRNAPSEGGPNESPNGGGQNAPSDGEEPNPSPDGGAVLQSGDEERRGPPFTMHGVLHFIEHEWRHYEMDRSNWEFERAELKARISFLLGERRAQDNLKKDLVRRIKMLEHTLDQERKTQGGQQLDSELLSNLAAESNVPMEIDAIERGTPNAETWNNARQVLRQFLQEIGYSEKFLETRSFRVEALLASTLGDGGKTNEKTPTDSKAADPANRNETSNPVDDLQPGTSNGSFGVGAGESLAYIDEDDEDNDADGNVENRLETDVINAFKEFKFLEGDTAL